jgi:hypothetical protein
VVPLDRVVHDDKGIYGINDFESKTGSIAKRDRKGKSKIEIQAERKHQDKEHGILAGVIENELEQDLYNLALGLGGDSDFEELAEAEDDREDFAATSIFGSILRRTVDVCAITDVFLEEAECRAMGDDEQDVGPKMSQDVINAFNDNLLKNDGPNQDAAHKRRQLERQDRLHQHYQAGELVPCCLSYYLFKTKDIRDIMLSVLRGEKTVQEAFPDPEKIPKTRLAKYPVGYYIIADRGFAYNAYMYPNFNPHLTPQFLEGRKQFTPGELLGDRGLCQLRYSSETVFSRITDEAALTDVVPTSYNNIMNDIWDWGHASANMRQPFRKPVDWEDYINQINV